MIDMMHVYGGDMTEPESSGPLRKSIVTAGQGDGADA
jgi:hypothetical protein